MVTNAAKPNKTKRSFKLPNFIRVGLSSLTDKPIIWKPITARNIPIPAPIPSFKLLGIEFMIHARNGVTDAITNNTPATNTAPSASAGE